MVSWLVFLFQLAIKSSRVGSDQGEAKQTNMWRSRYARLFAVYRYIYTNIAYILGRAYMRSQPPFLPLLSTVCLPNMQVFVSSRNAR